MTYKPLLKEDDIETKRSNVIRLYKAVQKRKLPQKEKQKMREAVDAYVQYMDENDIEYDEHYRPIDEDAVDEEEKLDSLQQELRSYIQKQDVETPIFAGGKLPLNAVYSSEETPPEGVIEYTTEQGAKYWVRDITRGLEADEWWDSFMEGRTITTVTHGRGEDKQEILMYSVPDHSDDTPYHTLLNPSASGKLIPTGATEVFISPDPAAPIQAVFRKKDGTKGTILNTKEKLRQDANRWKKYQGVEPKLKKVLSDLGEQDPRELGDEDRMILLIGEMAFRHGQSGDARIHEDGDPTGLGALTLTGENVDIKDDSVTFTFRGKSDIPHSHTSKNPTIINLIKASVEGKDKTDRLFNTTEGNNNTRLKELTGDKNASIKNIRTLKANEIAYNKIIEYRNNVEAGGEKLTFKDLTKDVGLTVGRVLGHKDKKVDKKTDTILWRDKASMALESYIDASLWKQITQDMLIQS